MKTTRFTKVDEEGRLLPDNAEAWAIVRQEIGGQILEWSSQTLSEGEMTFAQAHEAVKNFRLGGHTDWRLPTVEELFLLADRTRFEPAIDPTYFPDCESAAYWSGTVDASAPADCAWYVYFGVGNSYWSRQYHEFFVRAVRSGQSSAIGNVQE